MEFLSPAWFAALAAIILIDLVLAGDNAIVIALAARSLPPHLQRKAIVWGTVGAIIVRAAMTMAVVWLLRIPGLMLVGGLALLWIAFSLTRSDSDPGPTRTRTATSFHSAVATILFADFVMSLDNVVGVGAAAHGNIVLLLLGLGMSIGIVIFGGAFLVLDKITPYNLWKEIVQEHNLALAILLGAMSLGLCVIIAAAVH